MTAHARPAPLELGHGKTELEVFLEPTCPFSKKAFAKLPALVEALGADKITVRLRFISQPWHLFSAIVARAILAASATEGGKETAFRAMRGIYERREDFEFEDHSHGPNLNRTPAEIIADVSAIAGVELTPAFRLKSVDQAVRWHAKYVRQNGVHESPTFAINGIVERGMSSGQSVEEWAGVLRPHLDAA